VGFVVPLRPPDVGMNASANSTSSIATGTSKSIDGGGGSGGRTSGRITSDAVTPRNSRNGTEKQLAQNPGPRPGSSSAWAALISRNDVEVRDDDTLSPAPPLPLSMSLLGAVDGS
jgi:hypothetical protein